MMVRHEVQCQRCDAPVHEKTMMEINNRFSCARPGTSRLLAFLRWETVEAEQIAVLGEDNVFLMAISPQITELLEISCITNGIYTRPARRLGFCGINAEDETVEGKAGEVMEPANEATG
jgi:hypothetical protein